MTDDLESGTANDALATRSTAADWLIARRMAEDWSEADQVSLDRWLAQSPANRVAYWRLDGVWGQAKRLSALHQPMRPPVPVSQYPGHQLKIATAFGVMVAIAAVGLRYIGPPDVRTYTTPVGGHLTIALADGSKIELNTDSLLQVARTGERRQATLVRGEAYFQIEHDASHPFVVSAGRQRVTDLGTKFSVRTDSEKVFVSLFEGAAKVQTRGQSASRVLKPGDVAVATAKSITVASAPVSQLNEQLAWRRGMIEFKRATLADAAAELNRYNRTKIVIIDPHVARLTIHGTFTATDVWAFADAAQEYFNLRTEKRGNAVVIAR